MERLNTIRKERPLLKTLWLSRITLTIAIGFLVLMSTPLLGDDVEYDVPFDFGDSCDVLKEMGERQLMDLVSYKNQDYWIQFCSADSLEVCNKYSYLLAGIGYLTANTDAPGMCRFKRYKIHDQGPVLFPNFGTYFPMENFGYKLPY